MILHCLDFRSQRLVLLLLFVGGYFFALCMQRQGTSPGLLMLFPESAQPQSCTSLVEEATLRQLAFHSEHDDVIGWQTEDEVTELMRKLQGKQDDVSAFIDQLHLAKSENRAELGLD
jgi:hypothetical protein